jgi:hypothetical protein
MSDLATFQASVTRALLKGDLSDIEDEFDTGKASSARRFSIYRNNMFLSLTSHLRTVFPVTARLGDDRFFAYAADQFILREPPRDSRLAVYGATFPRFLSRFSACRHVPILAQMAGLEWAVHSSLTSTQLPFLEPSEMANATSGMTLHLQPSLRFVLSRWPLLGLWAHEADRRRPLPRKASRLAVVRHDDDIRFFELDAARFAFWRGLARYHSVERAAGQALVRDPLFSLVDEIVFLFRNQLVTGGDSAGHDKGSVQ